MSSTFIPSVRSIQGRKSGKINPLKGYLWPFKVIFPASVSENSVSSYPHLQESHSVAIHACLEHRSCLQIGHLCPSSHPSACNGSSGAGSLSTAVRDAAVGDISGVSRRFAGASWLLGIDPLPVYCGPVLVCLFFKPWRDREDGLETRCFLIKDAEIMDSGRKRKIETRGEAAAGRCLPKKMSIHVSLRLMLFYCTMAEEENKKKQSAQLGRVHCNYCKRNVSVRFIFWAILKKIFRS
jgi:hypothetical protein